MPQLPTDIIRFATEFDPQERRQ